MFRETLATISFAEGARRTQSADGDPASFPVSRALREAPDPGRPKKTSVRKSREEWRLRARKESTRPPLNGCQQAARSANAPRLSFVIEALSLRLYLYKTRKTAGAFQNSFQASMLRRYTHDFMRMIRVNGKDKALWGPKKDMQPQGTQFGGRTPPATIQTRRKVIRGQYNE